MTHACSTAGGSTPTRPVRWDSSWPAFVLEPQRSAVLGYFDKRFGIPLITFDNFCLLLRHKTYSLLSATLQVERLAGLQVHAVGLPVLRSIRHHLKPTTSALQHFGTEARRHILDLSETQVVTLLREREQFRRNFETHCLGNLPVMTSSNFVSTFPSTAAYNLRSMICSLQLKRLVGRRVKEFVDLHAAR